ncbi:MAG: YcxB family protein [Candidatus Methanofastidiosia archaeon]
MNQPSGTSLNLPITVRSTMTKSAYMKINLTFYFKSWAALLCFVTLIIATYLFRIIDAPFCILLVIWSLALFYTLVLIINAVCLAYTPRNFSLFLPASFTFDNDDFSIQTELGQSKIKWNGVIASKVVAGHYLLFVSATSFAVIPRRVFSPENAAAFEKLLHDKIKH